MKLPKMDTIEVIGLTGYAIHMKWFGYWSRRAVEFRGYGDTANAREFARHARREWGKAVKALALFKQLNEIGGLSHG